MLSFPLSALTSNSILSLGRQVSSHATLNSVVPSPCLLLQAQMAVYLEITHPCFPLNVCVFDTAHL